LKGQLIRQHQSNLYHSNQGRFATLRKQVYEHFREACFPSWNCNLVPDGVYWRGCFILAQMEPWGREFDSATYRRRLNELADKRVTNPPLLAWTRPGYYVLAQLEAS
jgi:hypothetical protein